MISSFQAALKNAVDMVAPPPTAFDDFTYHWKQLMNFYVNHLTNCKVPVETTNIPHHLDRLLDTLLAEETTLGPENPGPCLEYLLQHRLLDLLATLAAAETPPGMRLVCLSFLRKLLTRLQHPLLPHVSVYAPVQRLIALCNGRLASPTETEEIQFLVALCFLICKYPNLTYIMNDVQIAPQTRNDSTNLVSGKQDTQQITYAASNRRRNNSNPLFEPLETQAITLVNPNLHHGDAKRRQSSQSSQYSYKSERSNEETSNLEQSCATKHQRKISNESNTSYSSEEVEYVRDVGCVQKVANGCKSSVDEIHSKLKDLEELRIEPGRDQPFVSTPDLDDVLSFHDKIYKDFSKNCRKEFETTNEAASRMRMSDKSPKCLLLDALISYLNSADNMVRIKACEGIMVLASLRDPIFARNVVNSDLPFALSHKLETLFNAIPAHVDLNEIEEVNVTWGLDSPPWTNSNKFPGCRQVASFFMWLDYCDQLIKEADPIVGATLAENLRVTFFEKVLTPALANHHSILITALVTKCLKEITAPFLNTEFHYWLVGHQRDPSELPGAPPSPVLHQILSNCYKESDDLLLETLRLFEEIVEKRNEHALYCLLLSHLTSRGYYDNGAADSAIASWSDEEDEREKRGTLDLSNKQSHSRTLAPSNIHRIINCFLSLLPRCLQSDSDINNYEQYMADWEKQYSTVLADCATLSWPLEAVTVDDSASFDSRPEADHCTPRFYPGEFLTMIFEKITNIPNQRYEINLELTVLVSRLALLPHPYVHEFLLNPLLPLSPGTKSLFGCLQRVVKQIATQVPKVENYKQILKDTRQKLLEDSATNQVAETENILFESVVITEEFCKELAAIAYVKYHRSL